MQKHDEEMERYLKKFQPRAVRPLEISRQSGNVWMRRLAAAAVLVLAGGISLWYGQHKTPGSLKTAKVSELQSIVSSAPRSASTLYLTRLALEDNQAFEALLTKESRMELPDLQGEQSTLRVLAKE
jgi:hypothetical protein